MHRFKTLLLLLLLAFTINFIGCAPESATQLTPKDKSFSYRLLDFREYSNRDFLFTVAPYRGEYISLAFVSLTFTPEMKTSITESEKNLDFQYAYLDGSVIYIMPITANVILDSAYAYCLRIGADALSEFKISRGSVHTEYGFSYSTYHVNGFAIRRKS